MVKECTQELFLGDVAKHKMRILRDDGVYRHLRFSAGPNQWFEIVTWPEVLVLHGDMGSWTFSRTEDMFDFFRGDRINPCYWSEKLQSADVHGGAKVWDRDLFCRQIEEYIRENLEGDEAEIVVFETQEEVFPATEYEHVAFDALAKFVSTTGFSFEMPCSPTGQVWSSHFLWCCWAIVWGIQQYDKHNKESIRG